MNCLPLADNQIIMKLSSFLEQLGLYSHSRLKFNPLQPMKFTFRNNYYKDTFIDLAIRVYRWIDFLKSHELGHELNN